MPRYDDRFTPPAPLANVTLRNRNSGSILSDVPMQIDTGADTTLIPQIYISLLGVVVAPDESYELMGFDGHKSIAQVVELDLIFLKKTFKGRFLVINQDLGVLGRNILNHLSLLLDGPSLTGISNNRMMKRGEDERQSHYFFFAVLRCSPKA